jgi:P27 family predicted phage terminase small subunit
MGLRGPTRDPNSVRGMKERFRSTRDRSLVSVPLAPLDVEKDRSDWLQGSALEVWNSIVPLANREGLPWSTPDRVIVEIYCCAMGHLLDAEKAIAQDGMFMRTRPSRRRPDGVLVEHPALKSAAQLRRVVMTVSEKLGLTPASRARLKLRAIKQPAAAEPSRWAQFLAGPL